MLRQERSRLQAQAVAVRVKVVRVEVEVRVRVRVRVVVAAEIVEAVLVTHSTVYNRVDHLGTNFYDLC